MEDFISFVFPIFLVAFAYFLFLYPQRKRIKEHQKLLSQLKVGDLVVTAGGVIGRVLSISTRTLVLESAGVKLKLLKEAVIQKIDDNNDLI